MFLVALSSHWLNEARSLRSERLLAERITAIHRLLQSSCRSSRVPWHFWAPESGKELFKRYARAGLHFPGPANGIEFPADSCLRSTLHWSSPLHLRGRMSSFPTILGCVSQTFSEFKHLPSGHALAEATSPILLHSNAAPLVLSNLRTSQLT